MSNGRVLSNQGIVASFLFVGLCLLVLNDEMRATYEDPGWYSLPLPMVIFWGGTFIATIAAIPSGQEKNAWAESFQSESRQLNA